MKVTYLVPSWPPAFATNGIVTYVANLRSGMPADVATDVMPWRAPEGEPQLYTTTSMQRRVHALGLRLRGLLARPEPENASMALRMAAYLRAARRRSGEPLPDVLEAEETWGWYQLAGPLLRRPVVVRLHGPFFLTGKALGHDLTVSPFKDRVAAEGIALRQARFVTSPSRDVLEQTRRYYGLRLDGAQVLPNPGPWVDADESWSLGASEPNTVLFVGRFDGHKGGDVILDAFARMHPARRLVYVGPDYGLNRDGETFTLEEYLQRFPEDVRARIDVMGPQPPETIVGLRRRCRVTVVPSRYENFPMTVVEAFAFGSPLVTTSAGGIPEIVTHGDNGLVVPPEDPAALAEALDTVLDDPDQAARLAASGRSYYQAKLRPDRVGETTAAYYRSVVAQAR
ncbi:MAG: glycosyltransferase family 4 protein [Myxococcota bacterium]